METEYLDKNVGKPIYDYLKNGERYSSGGYVNNSSKLVVPFLDYLLTEIPFSDLNIFAQACRNNEKLSQRLRVLNNGSVYCYEKRQNGFENVPKYKYFKQNANALYRIFNYDSNFIDVWDRFLQFLNTEKGNTFLARNKTIDADVAFMNPEIVKPQWLIHFTYEEEDALDICRNGFRYGMNPSNMNRIGYSNKNISKTEKKNGKISYAYNALSVTNNFFPTRMSSDKENWVNHNKFDQKAWERAMHYAIMFVSSGVEAHHLTDKEQQVMFNVDMARDFVLLSFKWQFDKIPHELDTRNKTNGIHGTFKWIVNSVDGKEMYTNASLTQCIKWVMNNFEQYRSQICWTHNTVKEGRKMKKIHITEAQERILIKENIKIHKGEKGKSKSTQGKWSDSIKCPHCEGDAYFTMSISDGNKGRGKIKVTDEFGKEVDTEVQTIALYYCPRCYKFIAQNNMA